MESKNNSQLTLSMPIFKGDTAYSLDAVVKDLKSYWGLDIKNIEGDDATATFLIDDTLVTLALMPAPIPEEELEPLYKTSYLWRNAIKETKENTQHAIVSLLSNNISDLERHLLLTKINASILRTCENSVGVYQGSAKLLLEKSIYLGFADSIKKDSLPIQLWVYIGLVTKNGKNSVYTYGMNKFGKSEIEIIDSNLKMDNLYFDTLLPILNYILESDVILKNGETIGFSEEQKIKITESEAIYSEGNSLKLAF